MDKLELKYDILLKMQENVSLDPKELDGERSENELAILELESEGLVKTIKGQFAQYGRFLLVSLTDKGVLKQHQLRKEMSTPISKKIIKESSKALKILSKYLIEIIVGVAIAILGTILLTCI